MTYIRKGKTVKVAWPKNTNQEAWLELRAKMSGEGDEEVVRLGASEVSVATGSNTFQCAQRLFYSLVGWHKKDFINETLVAGHLQEPVTAARFESWVPGDEEQSLRNVLNGHKVRKLKKAKFFLLNSAYPYLSVSLDYTPGAGSYSPWTGEKYATLTPVELKHSNKDYYRLWPKIDQGLGEVRIARPYLEQINIQMLVSNTRVAVFLVVLDGKNFVAAEVHRDDSLLEEILPKVETFVENVKKGKRLVRMMAELLEGGETEDSEIYQTYLGMFNSITPPAIGIQDNLDLAYELNESTDKKSDQFKDATDQDNRLMHLYLDQNSIIKEAEAEKTRIRTELVYSAGKFQGIYGAGVRMVNRRADPVNNKKAYFSIA